LREVWGVHLELFHDYRLSSLSSRANRRSITCFSL
jgi:hypothetical protein